ncbi:PIN domain-like protein, partial [Scleroderma citrinum]
HTSLGESPEIHTIFYQLIMILQMLLHAHFVFDGPQRPKLKCGKQVKNAPHFLMQCFQELLSTFGFTWHEASNEAEAELAKLNVVGIIDAVFSDDSNILLFGAPCIIQSSLQHEHYNVIKVFTEDTLEHGAHLTQGGLLLIALMSSGDYNDGICGCGYDIAQKLAHYGLGNTLLQAATTLQLIEFMSIFCVDWCNEVCHVLTLDPLGILQCKYCNLTHIIQAMADFPNPSIIASYLQLVTLWSHNQPCFNSMVMSCQPDVTAIS